MPLESCYGVWSAGAGSGKTALCFHLACLYARRHPDATVLAIDLSPQADLSRALLGSDERGDIVMQMVCSQRDCLEVDQRLPKTIAGYLDVATSLGLSQTTDPRSFLINVSKLQAQFPPNLYLLCGDPSLAVLQHELEYKRNSSLLQGGSPLPVKRNAGSTPQPQRLAVGGALSGWKTTTLALRELLNKIGERKGIRLVAFVDMPPGMGVLAEIGLAACHRLLVPMSSRDLYQHRGVDVSLSLLFSKTPHLNDVFYYHRHHTFGYKMAEHGLRLPRIHLFLQHECHEAAVSSAPEGPLSSVAAFLRDHPTLLTEKADDAQELFHASGTSQGLLWRALSSHQPPWKCADIHDALLAILDRL